jgi:tyrosine decarboxylase/aspartate 1-decarboxylase
MFEEHGISKDEMHKILQRILDGDTTYHSGHPIASMSTVPHPISHEIFSKTIEKNAGRLHTFKGSAKIEKEVVSMIGDLLHLENSFGTTTSGGTESNILAMLSAREIFRNRGTSPEIVVPKTAHSSIDKAAWLLNVKLVKTDVDKNYRAIPDTISEAITGNTIGVFTTAGTTYLGQIDPIHQIARITNEHNLPLHVDAAFGGFVIPFLKDLGYGDYPFDFDVHGVTSISIDPHKMGLAPIPSGCLVFRGKEFLQAITKKIPYLRGASSVQSTLLGTRPAASIIATWAIIKSLGRAGYRKVVNYCMQLTQHAKDRIETSGLLKLVIDPVMNVIGIVSREAHLDDVVSLMEMKGWRMATSPLPASIRLVVMPHITEGTLNAFFNDLDEAASIIPIS